MSSARREWLSRSCWSPSRPLNADYHVVPTVRVGQTEDLAIKGYAAASTNQPPPSRPFPPRPAGTGGRRGFQRRPRHRRHRRPASPTHRNRHGHGRRRRTISVRAGKSATFTVEFKRTNAAYNSWRFGTLTWTDLRGHAVRSPLAVRPVALSGPGEIVGSGISGRATIPIRDGYKGVITASPFGLAASIVTSARLVGDDHDFRIPDGATA